MLDPNTIQHGTLNDFEVVGDLANDQIDKHCATAIQKCCSLSMAM